MSEQKGKYKTDKPSTFVPNAFQTPNGYVDDVMPFLTGEEYKVLSYATRRILGFQKRQDRISISQFTDGTKSQDGRVLDLGTGLGIDTVRKCLTNLVYFGLMVRIEENDPRTNEGTLWGLQWNEDEVNWQALYERAENRKKSDKNRIEKARSVRQGGVCGTERTPSCGTSDRGSCGTETQNTELEIQGNKEDKDSFMKVISQLAFSIFTDIQIWWSVKKILERDTVWISGEGAPDLDNPMQITIGGLNDHPKGGQFSLAEIWEDRFTRSFLNNGIQVTFQE